MSRSSWGLGDSVLLCVKRQALRCCVWLPWCHPLPACFAGIVIGGMVMMPETGTATMPDDIMTTETETGCASEEIQGFLHIRGAACTTSVSCVSIGHRLQLPDQCAV